LASLADHAVDQDVLDARRRGERGRVAVEKGEARVLLHQVAERLAEHQRA